MEKAKELERKPVPSMVEIVEIYKDGLKEAERLRKLLKPQWFVQDIDKHSKKKAKKKRVSPSRKKKTL